MQELSPRDIRNLLRAHQYRHANEIELHGGISDVLTRAGLTPQREVHLSERDRLDFLVDLPRAGGPPVTLGIEVKIAGEPGDVRRQLERYAGSDRVGELMLVTTRYKHLLAIPRVLDVGGTPTPVTVTLINRGGF